VAGDNQFGLGDLRLEVIDLGLRLGKNVASGGITGLQFFEQGTVFRYLISVPLNLGIVVHGRLLAVGPMSNNLPA
jgi:hypothetical protein